MNTRHEKVLRLFGHEIRFTITSNTIVKLAELTDQYIEDGYLGAAQNSIRQSIALKGFESVDDTIALNRINRRTVKE